MKTKIVLKAIALCCIFLLIFTGCDSIKHNNTTNSNELITKVYTVQEIEDFKKQSNLGITTFNDFKKRFEVECVRKTCQGYYCILRQDDEKNIFVFFNDHSKLIDIVVVKNFITKNEFENISINKTTESQILSLDPNTIFLPVSSSRMTAHIVDTGMFVITYSPYVVENETCNDPTVTSIEFIKDEELLAGTNDIVYLAPVVLPIDKG